MKIRMPVYLLEKRGGTLLKVLNESVLLIVLGILVATISSVPYLYRFIFPVEGLSFLGRSVANSADTYPLVANIESARQGKIILPNLYTTESQKPFMVRPTYLVLGLLSRIFNLDSLVTYHIGKFILAIIFVIVLWKFIGILNYPDKKKLFALLIVLFSSGLGFFVQDVLPLSFDLWVPESNTFFTLLESPHFISAQIFLITWVYLLYHYFKKSRRSYLLLSSIFSTLLILEHPFMIPFVILFSIILLLFVFEQKESERFKNLILVLLLPLVATVVIYYLYSISLSARLMNSQNILKTPTVINIITGYGLILAFAIFGIIKLKFKNIVNKLLFVWMVLSFILIYSPLTFQRRLVEGLHIPLALLAAQGIFYNFRNVNITLQKFGVILTLFIFLIATNIYIFLSMFTAYSSDTILEYKYHIHPDELAAMKWLRDNSVDGDVILANFFYSNIIPGITGRFVYNGHVIQSYKSDEKLVLFDQFMSLSDGQFRLSFIQDNKIDYIFFGKNDPYNEFSESFEKERYLKKVYNQGGVMVFKF